MLQLISSEQVVAKTLRVRIREFMIGLA